MKIKLLLAMAVLLAPLTAVSPAQAQDMPLFYDDGLLTDADIFVWQDTIAFFNGNYEEPTTPEGNQNFQVSTISWAGWGIFDQVGTYDFSAMSGFNLDFWVRTDIDLTVEMQDATNGSNGFPISTYGWDGTYTWQRITIPVTDFGRDLTQLESPFMITAPDAAVFYVDGVRWQDPLASNVVPTINSNPVLAALSNWPFKYDVKGSDANFDRLLYSLPTAPAGMTIDTLTGLIQWSPTVVDEGVHPITINANDGQGGVASQSFNLNVVGALTPNIYRILTPIAAIGLEYYLEWGTGTVVFGPADVTKTSTSFAGWGYFPPAADYSAAAPMSLHVTVATTADLLIGIQDGVENHTLRISDYGWDFTATPQQIVIPLVDFDADLTNVVSIFNATMEVVGTFNISNVYWAMPSVANSPPTITSTPVTSVGAPATYVYDVDATDPDNDNLTYALIVKPPLMGIDPNSGLILWLTELTDVGSHPVTVQVSDGHGNTDQQSFTVVVDSASATLYGDANEDGTVTSLDASQAARHSVGLITLTGQGFINADVSGDGDVTSIDASQIARHAVGLITCFPADPACP